MGQGHNGSIIADAPVQTIKLESVFDLERGFWLARDSLQDIYLAALSRMCSPWAVLGYCAAMALAHVRPNTVLPPIIGGKGSLNWFCAVAARSGGHKSSAEAVARELLPECVFTRNLGSGEGLVDAYQSKPSAENPNGTRESVMFIADEADAMNALTSRVGSTLSSTLRTAFTGGTLGFSYRGNKTHVEAHSYRLTLVVNIQPGRAGTLLDDQLGGMLQRFMWFPATDPRVTSQVPLTPARLTIPDPSAWHYPQELKVPYETIELIRDAAVRRNRGDTDLLDGHALFAREKLAFALAVLDGRDVMNSEDWRLAGIASRVSDFTRSWVADQLEQARHEENIRRGTDDGVRRMAASAEQSRQDVKRRSGIERRLVERVTAAGVEGITKRDVLHNHFNGAERNVATTVFDDLADQEVFVRLDKRKGERAERWVLAE